MSLKPCTFKLTGVKGELSYDQMRKHLLENPDLWEGKKMPKVSPEKVAVNKFSKTIADKFAKLSKAMGFDTKVEFIGEEEAREILRTDPDNLKKWFIGQKANLSQAVRNMFYDAVELHQLGKDSKTIYDATGWQIFPDGFWRYNLPTDNLFDGYGDSFKNLSSDEWAKEVFNDIADKIKKGLPNTEKKQGSLDYRPVTLGELYPISRLIQAYPELADFTVTTEEFENSNAHAVQIFNKKQIKIGVEYLKDLKTFVNKADAILELSTTLIHEIQHAIQYIEGFAQGGSQETKNQYLSAVRTDIIFKTLEKDPDLKRAYDNWKAVEAIPTSSAEERQKESFKFFGHPSFQQIDTEYIKVYDKYKDISNYEFYEMLLGEWEARQVSERYTLEIDDPNALRGVQLIADITSGSAVTGAKINIDDTVAFWRNRNPFGKSVFRDVSYLRTADGYIMGFAQKQDDGSFKIYIDPKVANPETPIHEIAGHVFLPMIKEVNPELYARGVELIKDSPYMDEVRKNYPELSEEDAYEEALAQAIGQKGVALTEQKRKGFVEWLKTFWQRTGEVLGLKTTPEQLADMTLDKFTDLVAGSILNADQLLKIKEQAVVEEGKATGQTDDPVGVLVTGATQEQKEAAVDQMIVQTAESETEGRDEYESEREQGKTFAQAITADVREYLKKGVDAISKYSDKAKTFIKNVSKRTKMLIGAGIIAGGLLQSAKVLIAENNGGYVPTIQDIVALGQRALILTGIQTVPEDAGLVNTEKLLQEKPQKVVIRPDTGKATSTPVTFNIRGKVTDWMDGKDQLWMYQRDADNGHLVYVPGPHKRNFKTYGASGVSNVEGVGHFLVTPQDLTHLTSVPLLQEMKKMFLAEIKAKTPDAWVPTFKKENNNLVRLTFKKLGDVKDDDIVICQTHQTPFNEIDFNARLDPEQFKSSVTCLANKRTGEKLEQYLRCPTENNFNRCSGGAFYIMAETPQGLKIREMSGSLSLMQTDAYDFAKKCGVGMDKITIGVMDAGSYSAKPVASKNKVVYLNQYNDYNTRSAINLQGGASLMIPKGGGVEFRKALEMAANEANTPDNLASIINVMNTLPGASIDRSIYSITQQRGVLDTKKSKRKGIVMDVPVVSIDDFLGKPILFTISDELTTGEITNPYTGQKIRDLKGGLYFNYSEGNTGYAWAFTDDAKANALLQQAKALYDKNPDKYPDGIVPVAVVKMGVQSMESNEAVLRQLEQNIKSFPDENKKAAFAALPDDITKQKQTVESRIAKQKEAGIEPTASDKALERGLKKGLELANSVKTFDEFVKKIKTINIAARPIIINRITKGEAGRVITKITKATEKKPAVIALMAGLDPKESLKLTIGNLVNNITEPSLKNVPDKHIISFVGVDATASGSVTIDTHPNYPAALKGKGLGILQNTQHIAAVSPAAYASSISKLAEAVIQKGVVTINQYLNAGIPAGLSNKFFRGETLVKELSDFDKLVGALRLAFPSVQFFTDADSWQDIMDNPDVKKYVKNGEVVYGLTKDGNIYLNPDLKDFNTPIHEAGHIWVDMLEQTNNDLLQRGFELLEGTKELRNAIAEYGDNIKARKEAMAVLIGNKGETIVNAAQKSAFLKWLDGVFEYVRTQFKSLSKYSKNEIANITLDKFVEGAIADILGGKELTGKLAPTSEVQFSGESNTDLKQFIIANKNLNTKDILNAIIKIEKGGVWGNLAEKLLNLSDEKSLNVPISVSDTNTSWSYYYAKPDKIVLSKDVLDNVSVILHEIIHAFTTRKLPRHLTQKEGKDYLNALLDYQKNGENYAVKELINSFLNTVKHYGYYDKLVKGGKSIEKISEPVTVDFHDRRRVTIYFDSVRTANKVATIFKKAGFTKIEFYGDGNEISFLKEDLPILQKAGIDITVPITKKEYRDLTVENTELSIKKGTDNWTSMPQENVYTLTFKGPEGVLKEYTGPITSINDKLTAFFGIKRFPIIINSDGSVSFENPEIAKNEVLNYLQDTQLDDGQINIDTTKTTSALLNKPTAVYRSEIPYGLANLDEFLAEAFTNVDFQQKLAAIPVADTGKSVWESIVDAVKRLLLSAKGLIEKGFGPDSISNSELDRVIKIGAEIIQQERKSEPQFRKSLPINLRNAIQDLINESKANPNKMPFYQVLAKSRGLMQAAGLTEAQIDAQVKAMEEREEAKTESEYFTSYVNKLKAAAKLTVPESRALMRQFRDFLNSEEDLADAIDFVDRLVKKKTLLAQVTKAKDAFKALKKTRNSKKLTAADQSLVANLATPRFYLLDESTLIKLREMAENFVDSRINGKKETFTLAEIDAAFNEASTVMPSKERKVGTRKIAKMTRAEMEIRTKLALQDYANELFSAKELSGMDLSVLDKDSLNLITNALRIYDETGVLFSLPALVETTRALNDVKKIQRSGVIAKINKLAAGGIATRLQSKAADADEIRKILVGGWDRNAGRVTIETQELRREIDDIFNKLKLDPIDRFVLGAYGFFKEETKGQTPAIKADVLAAQMNNLKKQIDDAKEMNSDIQEVKNLEHYYKGNTEALKTLGIIKLINGTWTAVDDFNIESNVPERVTKAWEYSQQLLQSKLAAYSKAMAEYHGRDFDEIFQYYPRSFYKTDVSKEDLKSAAEDLPPMGSIDPKTSKQTKEIAARNEGRSNVMPKFGGFYILDGYDNLVNGVWDINATTELSKSYAYTNALINVGNITNNADTNAQIKEYIVSSVKGILRDPMIFPDNRAAMEKVSSMIFNLVTTTILNNFTQLFKQTLATAQGFVTSPEGSGQALSLILKGMKDPNVAAALDKFYKNTSEPYTTALTYIELDTFGRQQGEGMKKFQEIFDKIKPDYLVNANRFTQRVLLLSGYLAKTDASKFVENANKGIFDENALAAAENNAEAANSTANRHFLPLELKKAGTLKKFLYFLGTYNFVVTSQFWNNLQILRGPGYTERQKSQAIRQMVGLVVQQTMFQLMTRGISESMRWIGREIDWLDEEDDEERKKRMMKYWYQVPTQVVTDLMVGPMVGIAADAIKSATIAISEYAYDMYTDEDESKLDILFKRSNDYPGVYGVMSPVVESLVSSSTSKDEVYKISTALQAASMMVAWGDLYYFSKLKASTTKSVLKVAGGDEVMKAFRDNDSIKYKNWINGIRERNIPDKFIFRMSWQQDGVGYFVPINQMSKFVQVYNKEYIKELNQLTKENNRLIPKKRKSIDRIKKNAENAATLEAQQNIDKPDTFKMPIK